MTENKKQRTGGSGTTAEEMTRIFERKTQTSPERSKELILSSYRKRR